MREDGGRWGGGGGWGKAWKGAHVLQSAVASETKENTHPMCSTTSAWSNGFFY